MCPWVPGGTYPNFENMGPGGFRVPGKLGQSGFRVPTNFFFVPTLALNYLTYADKTI